MTIKGLIEKVQEEKPNSFTDEKLLSFVNEVEIQVAEQINVPAPKYTDYYMLPETQPTYETWNDGRGWFLLENDEYIDQTGAAFHPELTYYVEAVLLAPAPYDQLYVSYVKSMIDLAHEEMANYQNDIVQHTQDFRDFVDFVVSKNQTVNNTFPTKILNVM